MSITHHSGGMTRGIGTRIIILTRTTHNIIIAIDAIRLHDHAIQV